MADGKTRIYSLPEITNVDSNMYIMLDSGAVGTRKYNLKTMYDKVDGVTEAAEAAQAAATSATTAASQASNAAGAANTAASQAQSTVQTFMADATEQMDGLVDDVNDAIDAIGDISELAVPLMSESTRGGAKLGHGLAIEDGALGIGSVTDATDAGPIVELTADGWAEQDSTTGKNLLPNTATSQTINGVTFTVNADGSITANGTASAVAVLRLNSSFEITDNATYTYSGLTGGSASTYTLAAYYRNSSGSGVEVIYVTNAPVTLNVGSVENAVKINTFVFTVFKGVTVNNVTVYPQLELGSTATAYEPYSGGAPSPSPSYPQEIRMVTGHTIAGKTGRYVDVDVQGRNLWSMADTSRSGQGIMSTVVNGRITASGTATSTYANLDYFNPIVVENGKMYSIRLSEAQGVAIVIRLATTTADTTYQHVTIPAGSTSATFTANNDFAYVRAYVGNITSGTSVSIRNLGIQINKGSTAYAYEPYYHTTIPIPLPSRGWVAALPDGTADTLTLDGAGGYVWELVTGEATYDGSSDESWSLASGSKYVFLDNASFKKATSANAPTNAYCTHLPAVPVLTAFESLGFGFGASANRLCMNDGSGAMTVNGWKTFLAQNPVTVLYPLATPTTESGYVDSMPTVPAHASISSSDLTDLAVRCCADEGAAEIAGAWGRRITALEQTVAAIVAQM